MLLSFAVNIRSLSDFAKMLGFVTPREVHPAYARIRIPKQRQQARTQEDITNPPPCNTFH